MWFDENLHLSVLVVVCVLAFVGDAAAAAAQEGLEDDALAGAGAPRRSIVTWALRAGTCPEELVPCTPTTAGTTGPEEELDGQSSCCPSSSRCIASSGATGGFACCPDGTNCAEYGLLQVQRGGTESRCADPSWTLFDTDDPDGEGQPFCCLPGQDGITQGMTSGGHCVDPSWGRASETTLAKRKEIPSKPKSAKQKKAEKIYIPILYVITCGWLPFSLIFVTVSLVRACYKRRVEAFNLGVWRTKFRAADRAHVVDAGLNEWGRKVDEVEIMEHAVVRDRAGVPHGPSRFGNWRK